MQRVCVFTGSNLGNRSIYQEAACNLGQALVEQNLGLVYGGSNIGLMGILANAVLAAGGEAIGVIPRGLFQREVAHPHLTKLYTVNSMHERKAFMSSLADAFIALPGGFGTFDELFEIITWAQLGIHHKPIILLNVASYFTPLLTMIQHVSVEGFILATHLQLLLVKENIEDVLDTLKHFQTTPITDKWTKVPPEG